MNKHLAVAVIAALSIALGAGVVAVFSSNDSTARQPASAAAAKDPCFRIGKLRWCVKSTPDQIADLVSAISDLTGGQVEVPPAAIKEIDFNTPSVPGGVTRCVPDSTKQFFDCH